jgi:N-acetylmuramoyl-L-alanine amidase
MLKVAIDPGHGGSNKGAKMSGFPHWHENDWTLMVAHKLRDTLDSIHGIEPFMLRLIDTDIKYPVRAEAALREQADVAVLLHFDSYPKFQGGRTYSTERSAILAKSMMLPHANESKPYIQIGAYNAAKYENVAYLLGTYESKVRHVVLVEAFNGYFADECERALSPRFIGQLCCAIAAGCAGML